MGHVLNDLCASMWFTYALVFYTAVIGISHSMAGVLMIVGQVADAISTPIIGTLSDRGSTKLTKAKVGKRKSWYIVGTVLVVCAKPFMFSPCFPCKNSMDGIKVLYYSAFIIVFQIGWAAVQTIHLAMVADLTSNEKERTFLLSLRNTMTAFCNSATYIGQLILIIIFAKPSERVSESDIISFQVLIGMIVTVGLATSVIFLIMVPEDPTRFRSHSLESSSHSMESGSHASSVHQSPVKILARFMLHYIGLIYLNVRLFVVAVQALLTLYLHESLKAYAYELATVPLVLNITTFVVSLLTGVVNELFGRKTTFMFGTISGLAACVWTYFGEGELYAHGLIYVVATFYGSACALLQITALALIAEYIGEDINNGAFIYGYMSFLDKISTGVTLALILNFHNVGCDRYFTCSVVWCCGCSSVLATILLCALKTPVEPIFIHTEQSKDRSKGSFSDTRLVKDSIKIQPSHKS
ncbi:hypothetical protein GE061_008782 [Apolygus lucorum]|uniref:Uncharacterized protein n=1 Tax=Apolygus lucorum TaxID=248454 RepID=A0A8S9WQW7_APOLU|nr:hypothetical protein GE061_008782 [Apolygus lucorum]